MTGASGGGDRALPRDGLQTILLHVIVDEGLDLLARIAQASRLRMQRPEERDPRDLPPVDGLADLADLVGDGGLDQPLGHDLDLRNLNYFHRHVPGLLEVSIGHALICDALTFGLENTVQLYLRELR